MARSTRRKVLKTATTLPPVLHRLMRHSSMQVMIGYYASVDDALHVVLASLG